MTAVLLTDADLDHAADILHDIQNLTEDALEDELGQSLDTSEVKRARFLVALGEFEERDLAESRGAKSCVSYLSRHYGQSHRAAQDFRTQARRLHQWPLVAMHMLAGRLTYSKMRIVLRYITEENQEEILSWAESMTCEDLRLKLSGQDTNDDHGPEEYVRFWVDRETGWLSFSMHLSPAHAAEFMAALKGAELLLLRDLTAEDVPVELKGKDLLDFLDGRLAQARENTEEKCPPESEGESRRPYHRALGHEAIFDPVDDLDEEHIDWADYQRTGDYADHQAWADDGGPVHDETVDPVTPEQPRPKLPQTRFGPPQTKLMLGAFMTMLRSFLARPKSEIRAPGAEVNVIIGEDGQPRLPGQTGATRDDVLAMVLNGALRIHMRDWRGVPIEMGSLKRVISTAVEKAVLTAWNHQCAGPGCTHSRFLQFHHIRAYSEGGPTDPGNLMPLCSSCHSLVTQGLMTTHIDESDPRLIHFRLPGGRSFTSRQRTIPQMNPRTIDAYEEGPTPLGDAHLAPMHDLRRMSFDD